MRPVPLPPSQGGQESPSWLYSGKGINIISGANPSQILRKSDMSLRSGLGGSNSNPKKTTRGREPLARFEPSDSSHQPHANCLFFLPSAEGRFFLKPMPAQKVEQIRELTFYHVLGSHQLVTLGLSFSSRPRIS